jgi:hypothetical protein
MALPALPAIITTADGRTVTVDLLGNTTLSEQEVRDLAEAHVDILEVAVEGGAKGTSNTVMLPDGMKPLFQAELERYAAVTEFADVLEEPGKVHFSLIPR